MNNRASQFEKLVQSLDDVDPLKRQRAIFELGSLKDVRAFEYIVNIFNRDNNLRVRQISSIALGLLGDERAVPIIISIIEDKALPDSIKNDAIWSLGHFLDPKSIDLLTKIINDLDSPLRLSAVRSLAALSKDPKAKQSLIALLNDPQINIFSIISLTRQLDNDVVDALIQLLESSLAQKRAESSMILGKIKAERATYKLTTLVYDSSWEVRVSAISALGEIGDTSIINYIFDALFDENMSVRLAAIKALGNIGTYEAIPKLEEMYGTFVKIYHDDYVDTDEEINKAIEKIRKRRKP